MRRAIGAATIAGCGGLALTVIALARAGLAPTTGLALFGLVFFLLGLVGGHGDVVIGGIGAAVLGAAMSLSSTTADVGLAVVVGVLAPIVLVLADASWWLRRDAQVGPEVVTELSTGTIPACAVGAAITLGVGALSEPSGSTIWLLPVAILVIASGAGVAGEISRRRRGRLAGTGSVRSPGRT